MRVLISEEVKVLLSCEHSIIELRDNDTGKYYLACEQGTKEEIRHKYENHTMLRLIDIIRYKGTSKQNKDNI
jgi:hypothetical protein